MGQGTTWWVVYADRQMMIDGVCTRRGAEEIGSGRMGMSVGCRTDNVVGGMERMWGKKGVGSDGYSGAGWRDSVCCGGSRLIGMCRGWESGWDAIERDCVYVYTMCDCERWFDSTQEDTLLLV